MLSFLTLGLVLFYFVGLSIRYFHKFIHEENWQYRVPFQMDRRFRHASVIWNCLFTAAHLFLVYHRIYFFLVAILIDRVVNFKPNYFWNGYPVVLIMILPP